jgi:uncharacterized membrane protein YqgA involved in biofilm formation
MIGVIANTIAVLIGGFIGLLGKKVIPETWNDIIIKGIGLIAIYVGITGALEGDNTLVVIMSIVFGAMIGEACKFEERMNGFAEKVERRFDSKGGSSNFAEGFITASLLMCVGALTVVGSLNAGLKGDNSLLFTKTAMDGVSAIMFTASMGIGVIFASIPVLVIEGGIVLLASAVAPVLTTDVVNNMTCAGSLLIIALGLNMTLGAKLKVMNYMPAVFLPIAFCPLYGWIVSLF